MFFEDIWSILPLKIDQMSKVCDRYCRQILSKCYSRLNDRFCIYKKKWRGNIFAGHKIWLCPHLAHFWNKIHNFGTIAATRMLQTILEMGQTELSFRLTHHLIGCSVTPLIADDCCTLYTIQLLCTHTASTGYLCTQYIQLPLCTLCTQYI